MLVFLFCFSFFFFPLPLPSFSNQEIWLGIFFCSSCLYLPACCSHRHTHISYNSSKEEMRKPSCPHTPTLWIRRNAFSDTVVRDRYCSNSSKQDFSAYQYVNTEGERMEQDQIVFSYISQQFYLAKPQIQAIIPRMQEMNCTSPRAYQIKTYSQTTRSLRSRLWI